MVSVLNSSEIDGDNHNYRISEDTGIEALAVSIREHGLITPLLVRAAGQGFQVVSGFRRIRALRAIGETRIPVRVVPECPDEDLRCARAAIADNAFQRELTPLEQARGVGLLSRYMDVRTIAEESLSVFNTRMNPAHVHRLLALLSLPPGIQDLLASDRLSMTAAVKLNGYDPVTLASYARLFAGVRVGLNKQVEIITHIHESAAREGLTPLDVLESEPVSSILRDTTCDESRKGNLIRAYLTERRFPEITRKQADFSSRIRALKLGPGIRIDPPANFEAMTYSLTVQFTDHESLKVRIKQVQALADNPITATVFL